MSPSCHHHGVSAAAAPRDASRRAAAARTRGAMVGAACALGGRGEKRLHHLQGVPGGVGQPGVGHPEVAAELDELCEECCSGGGWLHSQPGPRRVPGRQPAPRRRRHPRARAGSPGSRPAVDSWAGGAPAPSTAQARTAGGARCRRDAQGRARGRQGVLGRSRRWHQHICGAASLRWSASVACGGIEPSKTSTRRG